MKSSLEKYITWVIRHRFLVLFMTALVVLIAGSGVLRLTFKNDYRYFFSKENPELKSLEDFHNVYNKNDNILFVLEPKGGDVFTPSALSAVEYLTSEAWRIPHAIRVDSISNFQHTRAEDDELYVQDLLEDAQAASPVKIDQVRQVAVHEPLLVNRLVSRKGHVAGVNVTLELPEGNPNAQFDAVTHARKLAQTMEEEYPGLKLYMTGLVVLSHSLTEASVQDIHNLIPVMLLAILICTIVWLRSVQGALATFGVMFMSIATAMGLAGFLEIPLTPPSAAAPILVMTLAIADCVHILVNMFEEMRDGHSKQEALLRSFSVNIQPVFVTSFTTAIGFLSMNCSDAPPLRDLGNITAIGVTAAFIYAITFLPAFLVVLPFNVRARRKSNSGIMFRLSSFIINRNRRILYVATILVVVCGSMIAKNELDDTWVRYFGESIRVRSDTDFIHQNLTGIYQIEYSLNSGESHGIFKPEYLRKADEFVEWWRSQPNVCHVNGFTEIMKRLNKNLHGDDRLYYRIPDNRELAAQYLLLYEMSLPYGLNLGNQINIDKSSTRVTVTMGDVSSKELRIAAVEGEAWLKKNAPKHMHAEAVGASMMFAYISERNIKAMLFGTIGAIILISLTIAIAFRSFKFGILSLIPNIIPATVAFGIWGLLVGEVNMAISVVAALTLGIVVDDTVHLLSKFIYARRVLKNSVENAVRYSLSKVGIALIGTSLILLVGFGILSCSSFYVNAGLGRLSALTIVVALVADLFLLPAFLIQMKTFLGMTEDEKSELQLVVPKVQKF